MSGQVIALPWSRTGLRWHIACINWDYEYAPHACLYAMRGEDMVAEFFTATWADAIAHLDRLHERGVA